MAIEFESSIFFLSLDSHSPRGCLTVKEVLIKLKMKVLLFRIFLENIKIFLHIDIYFKAKFHYLC